MTWLCIGIGWLLLLALLIRFFKAVHRWDEVIEGMTNEQKDILVEAMRKANERLAKDSEEGL